MITKYKDFLLEKVVYDKYDYDPMFDGNWYIISKGKYVIWLKYDKEDNNDIDIINLDIKNLFGIKISNYASRSTNIVGELNYRPDIMIFQYSDGKLYFMDKEQANPDVFVSKNFVDTLKVISEKIQISDFSIYYGEYDEVVAKHYNINNVLSLYNQYKKKKLPNVVYHGTCSNYLGKILKTGILPTPNNTNFNQVVHDKFTFYSSNIDNCKFYARNSARKTNSFPIILEIDTNSFDENLINHDYDLYVKYINSGNFDFTEIAKDNGSDKDNILDYLMNKNVGSTFGKFSYKGGIKPKWITSIHYMENEKDNEFSQIVYKDEFKDVLDMFNQYGERIYPDPFEFNLTDYLVSKEEE